MAGKSSLRLRNETSPNQIVLVWLIAWGGLTTLATICCCVNMARQQVKQQSRRPSTSDSMIELGRMAAASQSEPTEDDIRTPAVVQSDIGNERLRFEKEIEHLKREIEALRASSTSNQPGGGGGELGGEAVTQDTAVEEAFVEAPASAEDIERQATTEHE